MKPSEFADMPLIADEVPAAPDWAFIVGVARAGTTALVDIINAHPEARMLNEAWLWGYVRILRTSRYNSVGEQPSGIRNERLMPNNSWRASDMRAILEGMRSAVASGFSVFGDKKWGYLRHIAEVETVLPECKLLATVRDPWDVAASLYDCQWFRESRADLSPEELAVQAVSLARSNLNDIHALAPERVHTINFEEMAMEPEPVVERLLEYLQLDVRHFDWGILSSVRYSQALGHWKRVPTIAALREAFEADCVELPIITQVELR